MNPNPSIDVQYLSRFLRECHWMRKSKKWHERLLYRLASAHLDTLTQRALAEGQEPKGKWQEKVTK
jgi:hypothetical protein